MGGVVYKESYPYGFNSDACSSCEGRCCTGESGYIFVSKEEIKKISKLLGLSVNEFSVKYLYKKGYKYSIKERKVAESYECLFYDKETNGCQIYMARPLQCKTFPFWEYYKTRVYELKNECPGVVDV